MGRAGVSTALARMDWALAVEERRVGRCFRRTIGLRFAALKRKMLNPINNPEQVLFSFQIRRMD